MKNLLSSQRLNFIPFALSDTDLFHDINTQSFVRQYLWDDQQIAQTTAAEIIQANEQLFKEHAYGLWKIIQKEKQKIIGYAGLWHFFDEAQPQLLYVLLESYTKQGYATEAARAVIDYAFNSLDFTYLIASMDKPNTASQQLAQRLGMQFFEGKVENGKETLFYRIDK